MHASFAAFAIAVFRNFVAEGVGTQVRDLAKERNGRLRVAILQLTIRWAHAAQRLNLAAITDGRPGPRLIANLAKHAIPAFAEAAFADVVALLMRDDTDAHQSIGIDSAAVDSASARIFLD